MRIGISGASGQLGKATLAELKARGEDHDIVGISRTPETVQPPQKDGTATTTSRKRL